MGIDERSRHQLFVRLEQVLGPQEAAVLMEHLPPVGWADVATKRDLEALRHELIADFRGELMNLQRHMTSVVISVVIGSMVALAGLAFAAARLV